MKSFAALLVVFSLAAHAGPIVDPYRFASTGVSAVACDGSTSLLTRATGFTNEADGKIVIVSIFFKRSGSSDGTGQSLISLFNGRFSITFKSTDVLELVFRSGAGTDTVDIDPFADYTGQNSWQHLLISLNSANPAERAIYTNGVAWSGTWIDYIDENMDLTGGANGIGNSSGGILPFSGCIAEVYVNTKETAWFDIGVQANREKFRSAAGLPVSLGADGSTPTGTAPLIYLKNPAATWNVNSAATGDFTVGGTFTGCTIP